MPATAYVPLEGGAVLCGRYRLETKLGEGGMGTVFSARDQELERQVAVKLLPLALIADAEVMERFEREARVLAKFDHPNIVPVYDVGRHEGRPFIVMKQVEGETLAALLRRRGGLTADETLLVLKQLGDGLDFIHAQNFIHRDVKAGNVVMGTDGHVTLLDFGILRTRDAKSAITREGMVMGTPHYMAPEQALGLRDVDHRADLYSLGVLLFECLTGTLPFEADSELRLIQLQAHAPPPEILDRAPWVPKPVADVVRRALAKRPEDRYPSGKELALALESAYRDSKILVPSAPEAGPVGLTTALSWRRRDGEPVPQLLEPSPLPPEPPTILPGSEPLPQRASSPPFALPAAAPAPTLRARLPLAAAVVLGVALVAVLLFRPGVPVSSAPLGATDAPAEKTTADAGAREAPALAEAVLDAGAPEALTPADAGAPRPEPRLTARRGHVTIVTLHKGEPWWAQVFLDGQPRGRTPLQLELAAGRYAVRVERSGFQPVSRDLVVASGRPSVMRIDLAP